jgi:hypothetical protein
MKKVRIFFAAAALLLVTAGVFAGKARFTTGAATDIYYYKTGSGYELVASGITSAVLGYDTGTGHNSTQSTFTPNDAAGTYSLYYTPDAGTHFYAVYY